MDILLIIITVVLVLIMFGVSFYLFAVYCHPQQKGIGNSLGSKAIVVTGLAISWCQLLLVPLDVSNTNNNSGIDMSVVYAIVYITIFVYVAAISPFTIFYYESDEEDPVSKRVWWSIFFATISTVVWCMLVFISYIWLSKYGSSDSDRISVPMYIMVCLSLVGWFLLALFGGIGLISLPVELIQQFTHRPKKLTAEEARTKKNSIEESSSALIEMGEVLKTEADLLQKETEGWWAKRKQTNKVNKLFEQYKQKVIELQQRYEVFENQLKIEKVNPVFYYVSLLLGIIFLFLSIIWIIQITLNVVFRPNNKPVLEFLGTLFANLSKQGLDFVSTGIFGALTIYLLWCVQKGNVSFGLRIPFIMSFHPMKKNETYLNSFLFNVNLMLLASVASTQLSAFAFSSYCQGTYIYSQFVYIYELPLFGWLYLKRVFPICMMVIMLIKMISLVIMEVLRNRRIKKKEEEEGLNKKSKA